MKKTSKRVMSFISVILMLVSFAVYVPAVSVSAITRSEVEPKLYALMDEYVGKTWTTTYAGAKQCKGFASMIFNKIFDIGGKSIGTGSTSSNPTNYKLNDLHPDVQLIGTVYNGSEAEVKALLMKAMPGDFIQMQRRSSKGPHSIIVVSVSDSGIDIFDCNTDGKCGVKHYSQSFSTFNSKNIGFSLYHSKKYSGAPVQCGCSTSHAGRYTTYNVSTSLNIRSEGAHSLSGSKVGSIPAGAEFDVTKADGNIAHVNYNGTTGIVSMAYIQRVQNKALDITLHVWISDTAMGGVPDKFYTGSGYYLCYELTESNSGRKINDISSLSYSVNEAVYRPNGSKLFDYTYNDSDNNWIRTTPDASGQYVGRITVTGDVNVTHEVNYYVSSGNITFRTWISETGMGSEAAEYVQGESYYICYELTDEDTGRKMNEVYDYNYSVTETVYNPDGSKLFEYTYDDSDNNWIRVCLDRTGSYRYEVSINGDISGTNDHTFKVSKHEHSYGSWTTERAATCIDRGVKTRKCGICGEKETQPIPETGHDFTKSVKAPTSSSGGYTLYTCRKCGFSYKDHYTDKLEFVFSASASSVTVDMDKDERKSVVFSYINLPEGIDNVTMHFDNGENRVTDLEWGDWDGDSVPLYISGCSKGTEVITVTLLDTATGRELGKKKVTVTVKSGSGSKDDLSISLDAGRLIDLTPLVGIKYGDEYGKLPTPERPGYEFEGWFTEKTGGTEVTPETEVAVGSDHTLYAHWKRLQPAGDVNGDGYSGIADVVALQKHISRKQTFSDEQLVAADLNDDGLINVLDVILLKRQIMDTGLTVMPGASLVPLK